MADSGIVCTTPIDIPLERSLYVGNMLSGILLGEASSLQATGIASYAQDSDAGLDIFAFFASVYCISNRPSDYRRGQTFYVTYDHCNYPGGPLGYFAASEVTWFNVLQLGTASVANVLGDGLVVRPIFA
jgi:hypothetical protein